MKAVLVGPYPYPGQAVSGGVERVIDTLMRELSRDIEVSLVVPNAPADLCHEVGGIPVIYLRRTRGPAGLRFFTSDARRVARTVRSIVPDIVHYQGIAGHARYLDLPGVLTVHGFAHRDILFKPAKSWLYRLFRTGSAKLVEIVELRFRQQIGHIIVINPYVEDGLPDLAALHRYQIANPIDRIYADAPIFPAARQRNIVSAGRIGTRKNTVHAVRLAALVLRDDPSAQAFFFGQPESPEYLEHCRQIAVDYGVPDRIHFPGNADAVALCRVLDEASVYLSTSGQETAPVAIAEALARGMAVVTPQTHGMRYMITEGQNGFFLPPDGNPAANATVLAQALAHPWDRMAIAQAARDIYSPAKVALRTLEAYRTILQTSTDPLQKSEHRSGARDKSTD